MAKDDRLIARVASLYYIDGLTQVEIADHFSLSRQMVGRILKSARESGIVEIRLRRSPWLFLELEEQLEKAFDLQEAIVVPCASSCEEEVRKTSLAQGASEYLARHVHDDSILGVSWGTTMARVAELLPPMPRQRVRLVQLNGGLAQGARSINAGALVHHMSAVFGAESYLLNAPAIVDSAKIRRAILSDSTVARTLDLANRADICVFSIGALSAVSVLVQAGYISPVDVDRLQRLGGVGDICSRYLNVRGDIVDPELNARTIGIELDALRSCKHSLAIAGGREKVEPIRGVLAGRYCNALVTDEVTARLLLGMPA